MDIDLVLENCQGFQWDSGNHLKSWLKHRVTEGDAEQIFFNEPLLLAGDEQHSMQEPRFQAMGHTDGHRYLFIVFTIRDHFIRVISARDMNKKERAIYEKFKTNAKI